MALCKVSLASQLEHTMLTITGPATETDPLSKLPLSQAKELPQAAPGFPDMTAAMLQWSIRAQQYNTVREIAGDMLEEIRKLRRQVKDAQNHCLGQSNKLREAHKLLTTVDRTTLPKDEILKRLDHSAFSIAASEVIFEHAAKEAIPPSVVIRYSDGREQVFQDGDEQQQRVVAGLKNVKAVLEAAAEDILLLGAPLTEQRRSPFTFPTDVLATAKEMPGGLTIENIRLSYQQYVSSSPLGSESERITLDVPHNEDEVVGDIPRLQLQVLAPAEEEESSTTPSAHPVEQKTSKARSKRTIKSEDDAATRSLKNAQELHKKRMRSNTTVITQGSVKQISRTKKAATVHLWNDHGHVVPSQASTDMSQHQGESALRCSGVHGSGWDVYGSLVKDRTALWCPECNRKMTESVPFWLPAGRFVYQLRLRWGLDEEGNVLNPDGIAIDLGNNNVTFYAPDTQGVSEGWTEGQRWFKNPVQQDAKKLADLSKQAKPVESMPVFDPGTRRAKGSNTFKGTSGSWADLASFHTKRFVSRDPKFVKDFGGSAMVNITLQTLIQAVKAKLADKNSKAFNLAKDWFVARDLHHWSSDESVDAFFLDIGLDIKRRPKKEAKRKEDGLVKQEKDQDVLASKKRKSKVPGDDEDGGQEDSEAPEGKRQKPSPGPVADIAKDDERAEE
jgi:hypothetical protein